MDKDYRLKVTRELQQKSAKTIEQYKDLGFTLEGILPGGTDEDGQKYYLLVFKISVDDIEANARKKFEEDVEPEMMGGSGAVSYYGLYPYPYNTEEIREYREKVPVRIDMGINGQLIIRVKNLEIDLFDVLKWVQEKMPSILETIDADYDDDYDDDC